MEARAGRAATVLVAAALAVACSTSSPVALPGPASQPRAEAALVLAARGEPETIVPRELVPTPGPNFRSVRRLFNAGLVLLDGQAAPRPYLAQEFPQLDSDSWRVLPDGRMETIYRLRPNLLWHDGAPLTADDFVFSWRVYSSQEGPPAAPINHMELVVAGDPYTVVIHWKGPYAQAAMLDAEAFPALPRHLLDAPFAASAADAFARLPFWTSAYVGLGPYRLTSWDAGTSLTGQAFLGHVWGPPRIPAVKVVFFSSFDAVLGALLADQVQGAVDDSLRFRQESVLKREWAARGSGGTLLVTPNSWRRAEIQQRPEYATPRALRDVRVRRALAHALDRQALTDALFEGQTILADGPVPPSLDYFPLIEPYLTKYAFDLRRAEQLMAEAGWARGADGVYVHPLEGRFSAELRANATPQAEAETDLLEQAWGRAGFEVRAILIPPAQSRVGEVRSAFPGLYQLSGPLGEDGLAAFTSAQIASSANGWVGANRGGWSNRAYDHIFETFSRTLDRSQRIAQIGRMAGLLSGDAATISLYFTPAFAAFAAGLQGPQPYAPGSDPTWNIHVWEWQRPAT